MSDDRCPMKINVRCVRWVFFIMSAVTSSSSSSSSSIGGNDASMSMPSGHVTHQSTTVEDLIWQDRDLRFDSPSSSLELRRGEVLLSQEDQVEDTKGSQSEKGRLRVTNLRVIFFFLSVSGRTNSNLSIGLACVTGLTLKSSETKLSGRVQTCHIETKTSTSKRYEFVFSLPGKSAPPVFTALQNTHRAYESTRLYRDLKLRGAIIKDHTLIMLPEETVYSRIEGVWNLSSDQGNLGTMFVTNVRIVWHASLAENFNVSIPFMQIKVAKIRDSKFGHALVIETSTRSGAYVLGFRIDPMEKLSEAFQEIKTLHEVFSANPVFGVNANNVVGAITKEATETIKPLVKDDVVIVSGDDQSDALAAVYALEEQSGPCELEYSNELGLTIERLPNRSLTISALWNVVPPTSS